MDKRWFPVAVLWGSLLLGVVGAASPTADQDALAYAQRALRHDMLLLRFNLGRASPDEVREIDRLKAEGQQILSRYAPGAVSASDTDAFNRKRAELSASLVKPGIDRAFAAEMPNAAAVATRYEDTVDRIAAFGVLAALLRDKTSVPRVPEAAARLREYEQAAAALDQQSRELLPVDRRARDPQFRYAVISAFMPIHAEEAGGEGLQVQRYAARVADDRAAVWVRVGVAGAVLLVFPPLLLMLLWPRTRPDASGAADYNTLPPGLRRITMPGISFDVDLYQGKVAEIEHRWERTTTTTVTPGTARDAWGMSVASWESSDKVVSRDPDSVSTSVQDHAYSNVRIDTASGHRKDVRLEGHVKDLAVEHPVLLASANKHGDILFDAQIDRLFGGFWPSSRTDTAVWLLGVPLLIALAYAGYHWIVAPGFTLELLGEDIWMKQKTQGVLFALVLLCWILLHLVRRRVSTLRHRVVNHEWAAEFRDWCRKAAIPAQQQGGARDRQTRRPAPSRPGH